jgi:hypothetical protein
MWETTNACSILVEYDLGRDHLKSQATWEGSVEMCYRHCSKGGDRIFEKIIFRVAS